MIYSASLGHVYGTLYDFFDQNIYTYIKNLQLLDVFRTNQYRKTTRFESCNVYRCVGVLTVWCPFHTACSGSAGSGFTKDPTKSE